MLVFRSLALGLVGACFLLLAFRPAYVVRVESVPPRPPPDVPRLVDVGQGFEPASIAQFIHLGPDEHVVEVDDRPVAGDLDAGAAIAGHDLRAGSYIDLTVAGARGQRRVLVLLH